MINKLIGVIICTLLTSSLAFAVDGEKKGGSGKIDKLFINVDPDNNEVLVTTTKPAKCKEMTLSRDDPNVNQIGYRILFEALLAAQIADSKVVITTDRQCRLFRIEVK